VLLAKVCRRCGIGRTRISQASIQEQGQGFVSIRDTMPCVETEEYKFETKIVKITVTYGLKPRGGGDIGILDASIPILQRD
jgi:hypothetical protein